MRAIAPQHPDWKTKEPFASLLSTDEFEAAAKDWLKTARRGHEERLAGHLSGKVSRMQRSIAAVLMALTVLATSARALQRSFVLLLPQARRG